MRSLSSNQRAQVVERYLAGESPATLATAFGSERSQVVGYLRRVGVQRTQSEAKRLRDAKRQAEQEIHGKRCTRCKAAKPLSDFYPRRSRRGGLVSYCKQCVAEVDRLRNRKPPNKVRERERRLAREYGITPNHYQALVAAQDGLCAVCGRRPDGNLCVDHDHETGRVRGLLCSPCNRAIGHLGDSADGLRRALAYLERDL